MVPSHSSVNHFDILTKNNYTNFADLTYCPLPIVLVAFS